MSEEAAGTAESGVDDRLSGGRNLMRRDVDDDVDEDDEDARPRGKEQRVKDRNSDSMSTTSSSSSSSNRRSNMVLDLHKIQHLPNLT